MMWIKSTVTYIYEDGNREVPSSEDSRRIYRKVESWTSRKMFIKTSGRSPVTVTTYCAV